MVRCTAAALLLVGELLIHVWALTNSEWSVRTMLPLHLCSVSVYLSALMLLARSRGLYEYMYFVGLGGALAALLTPDLGRFG
jgi:hypothetical integral membrane protein (TIGR02206 family)